MLKHWLTLLWDSDAALRSLCFAFLHFALLLRRLPAPHTLSVFVLGVGDFVEALQVLAGGVVDGTASLVHRVLHLEALVVEHGLEALVDLDFALPLGHLPEPGVLLHPQEALIAAVLLLLGRHGGKPLA